MKRPVPKDIQRDDGDYDVTRHVPQHVTAILWGESCWTLRVRWMQSSCVLVFGDPERVERRAESPHTLI